MKSGWQWTRQRDSHSSKEKRGGTAPNGQVLPDWLTWSAYETFTDGVVITTGEVLRLPLTYYGPSIPLGPDWVYGGVTSPEETPLPSSTSLNDPITSVSSSAATTPSLTQESTTASASASPILTPGNFPTSLVSTSGRSLDQSSTPRLRSSTTPPVPTSFTSLALPSSESTISTAPSATPANSSSTILPAILAPVLGVSLLALILIWLFCWRRRRRNRSTQGYTTAVAAAGGGFGGWLTASLSRRGTGGWTSAWSSVPDEDPSVPAPALAPTPSEKFTTKSAAPRDRTLGAGEGKGTVDSPTWPTVASPLIPNIPPTPLPPATISEKSALLGPAVGASRTSPLKKQAIPQASEQVEDEDIPTLARRNQSLLGRLTFGAGLFSLSSKSKSKRSNRRVSGGTLEKGTEGSIPGEGSGSGSGDGAFAGESGITDNQLFYRPPADTHSSRSNPSHPKSSSNSGSRANKTAESELDTPPHSADSNGVISVEIPESAETPEDGEAGHQCGPRMRFPVPPSSEIGLEAGLGMQRHSIVSNNTEFYSARGSSGNSASSFRSARNDIPNDAITPAGPGITADAAQRPTAMFDTSLPSTADRRSFPGQPLVDDTLLAAISEGRGRSVSSRSLVGEFGEPLRLVDPEIPTLITPSRLSRGNYSEVASYHSRIGSALEHDTSSDSGESEYLTMNGSTSGLGAIRGRRSQPQLVEPGSRERRWLNPWGR